MSHLLSVLLFLALAVIDTWVGVGYQRDGHRVVALFSYGLAAWMAFIFWGLIL